MGGETNLTTLLGSLSANLAEGVFVFATLPGQHVPNGVSPRMMFQEAEGVTLILRREEAIAQGMEFEFPSRMITLDIHSSLEAVGFIAHIASVLAQHDMGVNPVSAFYHDHLFVPEDRADDAMAVLAQIARENRG